ncbi:hypothetical protein GINT2_000335 [Glugoides intestinalis]
MKSDEDKTMKKTIVVRKKNEEDDKKVIIIPKENNNMTPLAGPTTTVTSGADKTRKLVNEIKKDNTVIVKEKPKELNTLAVPEPHPLSKEKNQKNSNVMIVQDKMVDPNPLTQPVAKPKKYDSDKVIEAGDEQRDLKPLAGPTLLMTGVMVEQKLIKENSNNKESKDGNKSTEANKKSKEDNKSTEANKESKDGNKSTEANKKSKEDNKSTEANKESKDGNKSTEANKKSKEDNKSTEANKKSKEDNKSIPKDNNLIVTGDSKSDSKNNISNASNSDDKKKSKAGDEGVSKAGKTAAAATGIAAVGTAIAVDKKNDTHVKIDESKNKNHDLNTYIPAKLENPDSDSLLHDLRRNGSIECEGFFYKKRMFFFCFWTEKYFVLLKTGQLLWLEEDGSGVGYGNWNIKQATAFNKIDYEGFSHPSRLCFSTGESTGYFAFDNEEARDFWFDTLQEVSRG